jgi:uncharacterized protein YneF (UPF0154 family)
MKKLLFFMVFGLAFLAGLDLGKWDTQKYIPKQGFESEPE